MLDRDDEQVIKDAKEGGAIMVTWDRVVRQAAGGITPYEAMDQALAAGTGSNEDRAEVSRLHKLTHARSVSWRRQVIRPMSIFASILKLARRLPT